MDRVTPRIGSLFTGTGALDSAVEAFTGGTVVWHSEIDKHASTVLAHHWPDVPNLGDITKVDWQDVPRVDILTGGFPCQDISTAGLRAGIADHTRSGLWLIMAEAISQLQPRMVVIENVQGLRTARAAGCMVDCPECLGNRPDHVLRALGAVLGDLAGLGFDAEWGSVRASDAGAPHRRERVFIVARPAGDAAGAGLQGSEQQRVQQGQSA